MEKIAVIGSDGQLGTDLMEVLGDQAIGLTKGDMDVTSTEDVKLLKEIDPDAVINTAAYVKVDDAELEPEKAFEVNSVGALNVARAAEEVGAACVYISTDYVFDGSKNRSYSEEDRPNPLNVYGASKYSGEIMTQNYCEKSYVVRTSSLFGKAGSKGEGGNIVETMIELAKEGRELKVIDDIEMSPTHTRDLAEAVGKLLENRPGFGTYHITNKGYCNWYDFVQEIFRHLDLEPEITAVKAEEFDRRAERPKFSVLSNKKLEGKGIQMEDWKKGLKRYLKLKEHI